jgi:hypothetical protein
METASLQMPFEKVLATVVKPATFRDVENRPYQRVGFSIEIQQPDYWDGDDYRSGRKLRAYVDGTKEVADIVNFHDGLQEGERIYLRIVEIGSFGGNKKDTEGRFYPPMTKLTVDHIELPGRPFKNRSVKAAAGKATDAVTAAEDTVLAGVTK